MKTKTNGFAALALCALLFCLALGGCGKSGGSGGEVKSFTLAVTHADGSVKNFDLSSDKEMLGDALAAEGLIEGEEGQYGLFVTTVDGETADSGAQQWWALTVDGETATTGVDSTPITEGAAYGLILTVGY